VQANIGVNGVFAADKAQKGRTVQAAIVMDIPQGYHVNSNRPLAKYSIPTVLKVESGNGVRVSPISYPRSNVRRFSFSKEQLAVYEGKAVLRFNVTVPANFNAGETELRAQLRFQSCNDEACFPPVSREVTMRINVVGANESTRRINGEFFGGGGRRRG
jgi:DsbC/DsbD-like thiol-disulfide interchange protein